MKTPQHWALGYANARKMEFQLFDPAGRDKETEVQVCGRLETYFQQISPTASKPLKVETRQISYPKQANDYDCAIWMIYYVESILRTGKCQIINTEEYRIELAKRVIELSKIRLN